MDKKIDEVIEAKKKLELHYLKLNDLLENGIATPAYYLDFPMMDTRLAGDPTEEPVNIRFVIGPKTCKEFVERLSKNSQDIPKLMKLCAPRLSKALFEVAQIEWLPGLKPFECPGTIQLDWKYG